MADALDAISFLLAEVAHLRAAAAAAPRVIDEAPHARPDRDRTLRSLAAGMDELADAVQAARRHRAATLQSGSVAASANSSAGSKRFRGWREHRARGTSPGVAMAADGSGLSGSVSARGALLSPTCAAQGVAPPREVAAASVAAADAATHRIAMREAYTEGLAAIHFAAAAGAEARGEAAPVALLFATVLPAVATGSSAQLLASGMESGVPLVIRLRRLVGPLACPQASTLASPLTGPLVDSPTGD